MIPLVSKRCSIFIKLEIICVLFFLSFLSSGMFGQNYKEFSSNRFPSELIDSSIILKRGLESQLDTLLMCDWDEKIGKKIDVFWLSTPNGDFFGHVYEYFMECNNVRLIYWSPNGKDIFPIVDFMIEDLESDSQFVSSKKRHLKNNRKYKKYLD